MPQYKPGDKVKIISLEKVRSYPESEGSRFIGGVSWINKYMDEFAGNTYEIVGITSLGYRLDKSSGFSFSPEMIEGPAEEAVKYAERLERFVLAVAAGQEMPVNKVNDKSHAKGIVEYAVELLAAFEEEIKKHRI